MSRSLWRVAVIARIALLAAAWPLPAHADAVDDAVDAVATVGHIAGVPIRSADKPVLKALMSCATQGGQMHDCARQVAIEQLPPATQPIAHCMQLGLRFEHCGTPEILRRVPLSARALARCIAERSAIGGCAALVSLQPRQRHVLQVIDKLQADARYDLQPTAPRAMRSLIGLAEAMRDGNWEQVELHGGREVLRVALKNNKARARVT
jgi:hypothetical protein